MPQRPLGVGCGEPPFHWLGVGFGEPPFHWLGVGCGGPLGVGTGVPLLVQFGYQLGHCTGRLLVGGGGLECGGELLHVVGGAEVVCLGGVLLCAVDDGGVYPGTVDPGGGTVPVPP